jgi:hypothetical protein
VNVEQTLEASTTEYAGSWTLEDAGSSTTDGVGSGTADDAVSNTAEVSNYKNIYMMHYINSIISKCDQSTVKFIDARMNIILHFALFMNKSLILMVNNSTNINNENNQFSIEHKKHITYGVINPGSSLGQVTKCGRVKPDNDIQILPF